MISFEFDLKLVYAQNTMQRRFVTCYYDVATRIIAVSRTFHSSIQNVFCGTVLIFLSLNTNKCSFWKLNNRFYKCFYHNAPEVLVENRAYILSELLTQGNTGCKTLNNDHYDYTYYQRLSASHVLLLYQISVSFSHFFQRQFSHAAWRNFYMN